MAPPLIPPKEGGLRGHGDVSVHGLALRVEHGALDDGLLGVGRQRGEGKERGDDVSIHIYYGCFEVAEKLRRIIPTKRRGVPIGLDLFTNCFMNIPVRGSVTSLLLLVQL